MIPRDLLRLARARGLDENAARRIAALAVEQGRDVPTFIRAAVRDESLVQELNAIEEGFRAEKAKLEELVAGGWRRFVESES